MPFYTEEEIERRKAEGVRMNRVNCGWNLPTEITIAVASRIAEFNPVNDIERRNKRILELAFIHDMNPQQIARLNDPEFIGIGNRSKGKPLSSSAISSICMAFAPEVADYRSHVKQTRNPAQIKRTALYKQRQTGEIHRQEVCATCGSKEDIELHHIIPVAVGGTDDYFNLISLCHACHMKLHHTIYDRIQWKSEISS